MKTELTHEERQATLDAIGRFRETDPELAKTYEIEFVVANFISSLTLDSIELFLKHNGIEFLKLTRSGSDLLIIIQMKLDKDKILEVESYLTYFANEHGFKYDGWGAFE